MKWFRIVEASVVEQVELSPTDWVREQTGAFLSRARPLASATVQLFFLPSPERSRERSDTCH